MAKIKTIIFPVAAILLGAVTAFVLGEAAIRLFAPLPGEMTWLVPDERYGHVLKPDYQCEYSFPRTDFTMRVKTNSMGLRDTVFPKGLPADSTVLNILLLGDSFTFGHGLNREDIFDAVLERLLENSGRRALVFNAGVSGWGTAQATLFARDHFEIFRPDVVVYTFCGNDPVDDSRFLAGQFDTQRGSFYFPGKIFLRKHSQLFRFLLIKYNILSHRIRMGKKLRRDSAAQTDDQSGVVISPGDWTRSLQIIGEFHRDFLAFNPDGVLLVQASEPGNADIQEQLGFLDNGKNLLFVDLGPYVRDLSKTERRLPYDGHWSAAMHERAAACIFDYLKRTPRLW